MYAVNLWCSHPDEDNDDCSTGDDFDNKADALACYNDPFNHTEYFGRCESSTAFIQIDGPDIHEVRANPTYKPSPVDDDDWRREMAMEAGMLHGCDAYNEQLGY